MNRFALMLLICLNVGLLAGGCASLRRQFEPSVEDVNLRFEDVDFRSVAMAFDIDVKNPNPFPLKTPRMRYALNVAGTEISSDETPAGVDLPENGVGTATLPFRLDYADLYDLAGVAREQNEADFVLSGDMLFDLFGRETAVPFRHEGKLPILKLPKFRFVGIEPKGFGLGGTEVEVKAEVENPNAFGIGLDEVLYRLQAGDIEIGSLAASSEGDIPAESAKPLRLTGKVSGADVLTRLLSQTSAGDVELKTSGALATPYGKVGLTP